MMKAKERGGFIPKVIKDDCRDMWDSGMREGDRATFLEDRYKNEDDVEKMSRMRWNQLPRSFQQYFLVGFIEQFEDNYRRDGVIEARATAAHVVRDKQGNVKLSLEPDNISREWTPSKAPGWKPPTKADISSLPKPAKNQMTAGSPVHSFPLPDQRKNPPLTISPTEALALDQMTQEETEALTQGYNDRARKILVQNFKGQHGDYTSTTPIDDAIEFPPSTRPLTGQGQPMKRFPMSRHTDLQQTVKKYKPKVKKVLSKIGVKKSEAIEVNMTAIRVEMDKIRTYKGKNLMNQRDDGIQTGIRSPASIQMFLEWINTKNVRKLDPRGVFSDQALLYASAQAVNGNQPVWLRKLLKAWLNTNPSAMESGWHGRTVEASARQTRGWWNKIPKSDKIKHLKSLKNAFGKDDWSELLWQKNLRKERNLPRSPNIHSLRYDDLPSDIQGVLQDLIDYVKNEKHPMPESYVEHHTGEPHSHGIMHELKNDIREMHSKLLSMEESMNGLKKQGDESEEPDQKAGFIREFDRLKTGYGITERRYKQAIREYRKLRERGVEDQKRSQWLLENTAKISLIESVTERQKALEAGETTIDDEIAHTEQQLRLSQGHYLQRNYFKQKLEALKKKKKAGETHYKYQRRHYIKIGNTLKNLPKEEKQKEFKKWDEIFRADNERYDSQKFADFIGLFSGEARKVVKKKLQ